MPYAIGPEQRVNTYVLSRQSAPQSIALSDGGYVTVWSGAGEQDRGYGIYLQRFDADGNRIGDQTLVNSTITYSQRNPVITELASGGFVITWDNTVPGGQPGDPGLLGVFAQVFDASGARTVNETQVSTVGYAQTVTALSDGGYLISWTQRIDSPWSGVVAQRFDASGQPVGAALQLDDDLDASYSSVSATDTGYIATWRAYNDDGPTIAVQRFAIDGTRIGDVARLPRDTQLNLPEIVSLAEGGSVVVWSQTDGLYAQVFDGDGQPVGDRFMVDAAPPGVNMLHAVVATPDGGFTLAWEQFSSGLTTIEARAFLADGTPNGDVIVVRGPAGSPGEPPSLTVLSSGDVVVSYARYVGDVTDFYDVFQVRLEPLERTLRGSDEVDQLVGRDGQDRLLGLEGDDVLTGGRGNDVIDGGEGWDEAVFSGSWADYRIFEADGGYRVKGADGSDVLTGIEQLRFDDRVIDLLMIVCDPPTASQREDEMPLVSPLLPAGKHDFEALTSPPIPEALLEDSNISQISTRPEWLQQPAVAVEVEQAKDWIW
ncbi:hypothetical protein [Brevundimonas sp.]|uniref:calcium-binding protein n=1 Tax=Brevundimonas sp. TaxID=1871086 RepID=UPI0035647EDE